MKKLNTKKFMFSLSAITVTAAGAIFFSQSGGAATPVTEDNIGLAIDKLDKDTLKISLSNVVEMPKALQFSVKLDGDISFNEDSLNWLVTNTANSEVQKQVKLSDDKKALDFYIVSNQPLTKSGGTIEIGEINVISSKEATKYTLTSDVHEDGTGYKYVVNATNKQVTGPALTVDNGGALTYNTLPQLELIDSSKIVEGKIMLTVGDSFTNEEQLAYVIATDEEDDNVTVTVEGNVDTSIIGSYTLTYKVTDSLNETTTLTVPVIVENKVENASNPVIEGVKQQVELTVGDSFDVLEGITAVDHTGYNIIVKATGDYTTTLVDGIVTKSGIYTIQYDAQDRWGNPAASQTTTLIVAEKPSYIIPDVLKPLIDETVVSIIEGEATQANPLALTVVDSAEVAKLQAMMESFNAYEMVVERQEQDGKVTYDVTLTNGTDTYYLVMTALTTQTDVVNYLDSLVKDATTPEDKPSTDDNQSGTTTPEDKPSTDHNQSGTTTPEDKPSTDDNQSGTTTPENKPSIDNNGTGTTDSDNQPETGVEAQLPLIISGALAVVAGMWLLLKRKVVKK